MSDTSTDLIVDYPALNWKKLVNWNDMQKHIQFKLWVVTRCWSLNDGFYMPLLSKSYFNIKMTDFTYHYSHPLNDTPWLS